MCVYIYIYIYIQILYTMCMCIILCVKGSCLAEPRGHRTSASVQNELQNAGSCKSTLVQGCTESLQAS